VTAEAARTGATLLAEGIETEDHAQLAVRMGARLGQGWLFGRPAPLPTFPMRAPAPSRPRPLINVASRVLKAPPAARTTKLGTPYSVVVATANTANTANTAKGAQRVATKPVLHAISTQLERRALAQGHSVVVLGAFQHARHFTGATAQRYRDLAVHSSYVAAFATDLPPDPMPGVNGITLPEDDPLVGQWCVIVVAGGRPVKGLMVNGAHRYSSRLKPERSPAADRPTPALCRCRARTAASSLPAASTLGQLPYVSCRSSPNDSISVGGVTEREHGR